MRLPPAWQSYSQRGGVKVVRNFDASSVFSWAMQLEQDSRWQRNN
jgi:hypothetical protein